MNRIIKTSFIPLKLIFVGILFAFAFSQCKIYTAFQDIVSLQKDNFLSVEKGTPRLEYIQSIPMIHLYGSPYEMGLQYGTILKKQLNSLVELTHELFPQKKIDEYIENGKVAEKNLPEKLKLELKGMSAGSGVDYSILLALNMATKADCSTLAVWGKATPDGNLIMGRNADYIFKKINKAVGLIVVKHPSEGLATFSVTFLGLLGTFTGMNESGLSYGNMLVYNGKDHSSNLNGLPIQLLMQLGGEKMNSAGEMAEFLSQQTHMININVMCADSNEAFVTELSHTQSAIRSGEEGILAATNYFTSPDLYEKHEPCNRFTNLMSVTQKNYGKLTVDDVKKAMHIARRKRGRNLQCVIFEPAAHRLHVSINKVPASKGPFTEFDIKSVLEK